MYADGGERRKLPDSAEPYGRNTESTATKWENRGSIKVINFTSPSKETTSIARLSATLPSPSFPFLCAFSASVSCCSHWQMSSGEPSRREKGRREELTLLTTSALADRMRTGGREE